MLSSDYFMFLLILYLLVIFLLENLDVFFGELRVFIYSLGGLLRIDFIFYILGIGMYLVLVINSYRDLLKNR